MYLVSSKVQRMITVADANARALTCGTGSNIPDWGQPSACRISAITWLDERSARVDPARRVGDNIGTWSTTSFPGRANASVDEVRKKLVQLSPLKTRVASVVDAGGVWAVSVGRV